jgi:molybdate transport system substrate-binding protein
VNQFLLTGAADLGLTAKSVLASPQMGNTGRWQEVDSILYVPIRQAMVLTKSAGEKGEAFRDFLMAEDARRIWRAYGYLTP